MAELKEVVITQVITLLKKGYSRYRKDDQGFGSIQEHYGLTFTEMKNLFAHPLLKGIKRSTSRLVIVEDVPARPLDISTPERREAAEVLGLVPRTETPAPVPVPEVARRAYRRRASGALTGAVVDANNWVQTAIPDVVATTVVTTTNAEAPTVVAAPDRPAIDPEESAKKIEDFIAKYGGPAPSTAVIEGEKKEEAPKEVVKSIFD